MKKYTWNLHRVFILLIHLLSADYINLCKVWNKCRVAGLLRFLQHFWAMVLCNAEKIILSLLGFEDPRFFTYLFMLMISWLLVMILKSSPSLKTISIRAFAWKIGDPWNIFGNWSVSWTWWYLSLTTKILARYHLRMWITGARPVDTPIKQNHRLALDYGPFYANLSKYRRLIGRLVYLALTRPELSSSLGSVYVDSTSSTLGSSYTCCSLLKGLPRSRYFAVIKFWSSNYCILRLWLGLMSSDSMLSQQLCCSSWWLTSILGNKETRTIFSVLCRDRISRNGFSDTRAYVD